MTCDVQDIPPAQRPVLWSTILTHRWPLGLTGLMMSIYGGLISLMLFYAHSGKARDDARLQGDSADKAYAEATIDDIRPSGGFLPTGVRAERVHYRFEIGADPTPLTVRGQAFAGEDLYERAYPGSVEYLISEPGVNRLVGSRLCLLPDLVTPMLILVVAPGLLLVGVWLRGVLVLRQMMSRGDIAVAEPIRVERVAWVIPMMLRADYRFRDHHARWCEGHHWIRARSELGQRLSEMPSRVAVVHDRSRPERSRLITPQDFSRGRQDRHQPHPARRA